MSGLRLVYCYILCLLVLFVGGIPDVLSQNDAYSNADSLFIKADSLFDGSNYEDAIVFYQIASENYLEDADTSGYLNSQIKVANSFRVLGDYVKASQLLHKIQERYGFMLEQNNPIEADFYHVFGTLQFNQGKLEQAILLLQESVSARIKSDSINYMALALTYNNIGTNYLYLGDNPKALSFYERALEIATEQSIAENASDIAMYYMNIGIVYAKSGDFDKASEYFKKNLKINREILNPLDLDLALIYNNLGRLNYLLSNRDEAIKYHNQAENLIIKRFGDNYYALGEIYVNKGNIYRDLGNFDKALDHYKKSLQIYLSSSEEHLQRIAPVYTNIGSIYFIQADFKTAIDYFNKSFQITNDPISQTLLLRNIAETYQRMGQDSTAQKYLLRSISVAENQLSKNHYELGNSYLTYGEFLLNKENSDLALDYFRKAEDILISNFSFKSPHLSRVYTNIASFYQNKEAYSNALKFYQKGLIANIFGYADTNIYSLPEIDSVIFVNELLSPLLGKAETFASYYDKTGELKDLQASLNAYELAIDIVDDIRSGLTEESKMSYVGDVRDIYQDAITTCLDLYLISSDQVFLEEAFQFSEKSRSSVLLSSIRDVEAMEIGGIPDSLQKREKEIRERINAYEKLIYDEREKISRNQEKIDLWEGKLFDLKRDYDELIIYFENNYQSYYRLKYDSDVLKINELQTYLDDDEAFLEYSRLDSTLIIFLVRNDTFKVVSVNVDSSFNQKISFLIDYYQSSLFHHSPEVYNKFVSSSNDLYNILIRPVEDYIGNRQITIVPDGNLNYIPFETLIREIPVAGLMDYRGMPYLIKSNPISYSFSATILYEYVDEKFDNDELLAFVPQYDKLEDIATRSGYPPESQINLLDPLDNARREVESISKIVRGKSYYGKEATETKFRQNATEYGILHLAMHTIIDDVDPMYSRLIFTQTPEDTINDGFLYAYELYNMNLNANMAVLSACNTGFGKLRKGEGVISIARGFTYSGVPSVIMTLWEVEDKAGATIMTSFYENIENGMDKDVALQKAKVAYLNQASQFRSHPYFWSAYVTIGDVAPVMNRWSSLANISIYVGAFILLLGASAIFYRKRVRIQSKK